MEKRLTRIKAIILSIVILFTVLTFSIGLIGLIESEKKERGVNSADEYYMAELNTFYEKGWSYDGESFNLKVKLDNNGRGQFRLKYYDGDKEVLELYLNSTSEISVELEKGDQAGVHTGRDMSNVSQYSASKISIDNALGLRLFSAFASCGYIPIPCKKVVNYGWPLQTQDRATIELCESTARVNGLNCILKNDITISSFMGIGGMHGAYSGQFDGNQNTINIGSFASRTYTSNAQSFALFAHVEGATIYDLILNFGTTNVNVNSIGLAGGMIGFAGDYGATVKNCMVTGKFNITSSSNGGIFGGVVGQANGNIVIENCAVKVNINTTEFMVATARSTHVGGIVGVQYYGQCKIINSYYRGEMILNHYPEYEDTIGGLLGNCKTDLGTPSCYFYGNVIYFTKLHISMKANGCSYNILSNVTANSGSGNNYYYIEQNTGNHDLSKNTYSAEMDAEMAKGWR